MTLWHHIQALWRHREIQPDESVVFLPTIGARAPDSSLRIPVHAWVYKDLPTLSDKQIQMLSGIRSLAKRTAEVAMLGDRLRMFLVDNKPHRVIRTTLHDDIIYTGKDGHATEVFPCQADKCVLSGSTVEFAMLMPEGDDRVFWGRSHILKERGLSIISDIDDTIKTTNVAIKSEMLRNTFMRPFRAVEGMAELYQEWEGAAADFHYLSSSPIQLYPALEGMMRNYGFPRGSVHLRKFRIWDESLENVWQTADESKLPRIREILTAFPQRDFILIGDSGERDPEIYGHIAREFPSQIKNIIIRDVSDSGPARYRDAFTGIYEGKWFIFRTMQELLRWEGRYVPK